MNGVISGEAPPFIMIGICGAMLGVVAGQMVYADRHGLSRQGVFGRLTLQRHSLVATGIFLLAGLIQLLSVACRSHGPDPWVMALVIGGQGMVVVWVASLLTYAEEHLPPPAEEDVALLRRFIDRVLAP